MRKLPLTHCCEAPEPHCGQSLCFSSCPPYNLQGPVKQGRALSRVKALFWNPSPPSFHPRSKPPSFPIPVASRTAPYPYTPAWGFPAGERMETQSGRFVLSVSGAPLIQHFVSALVLVNMSYLELQRRGRVVKGVFYFTP